MNNLNFRFWNKKTKKFEGVCEFCDLPNFLGDLNYEGGEDLYKCYEIHQSTGLLDINDKEIFDGDLIKGDGYGPYRVFWHKGMWCSCCYSDYEPLARYKSIKVVSNIFETPKYEGEQ